MAAFMPGIALAAPVVIINPDDLNPVAGFIGAIEIPFSDPDYADMTDAWAAAATIVANDLLRDTAGEDPDYSEITALVEWNAGDTRFDLTLTDDDSSKYKEFEDITITVGDDPDIATVAAALAAVPDTIMIPFRADNYNDDNDARAFAASEVVWGILDADPKFDGVDAVVSYEDLTSEFTLFVEKGLQSDEKVVDVEMLPIDPDIAIVDAAILAIGTEIEIPFANYVDNAERESAATIIANQRLVNAVDDFTGVAAQVSFNPSTGTFTLLVSKGAVTKIVLVTLTMATVDDDPPSVEDIWDGDPDAIEPAPEGFEELNKILVAFEAGGGTTLGDLIGSFKDLPQGTSLRVTNRGAPVDLGGVNIPVGTGKVIEIVDEDGTVLDSMVVVIQGDLAGTGTMCAFAVEAFLHHVLNAIGSGEMPQLTGAYLLAAIGVAIKTPGEEVNAFTVEAFVEIVLDFLAPNQ